MLEDYIIFKEIKVISELLKWYTGIQGKSSQTGVGYQEKMNNGWMNVHACAWSCLPTEKPMKSRSWWCSTNWKRTSSSNLIKKNLRSTVTLHLAPKFDVICVFPTLSFLQKNRVKVWAPFRKTVSMGPVSPLNWIQRRTTDQKNLSWLPVGTASCQFHWQTRQKEHKPPWEGAMTGIFEQRTPWSETEGLSHPRRSSPVSNQETTPTVASQQNAASRGDAADLPTCPLGGRCCQFWRGCSIRRR